MQRARFEVKNLWSGLAVFCFFLLGLSTAHAQKSTLNGTYLVQGTKGAIVLTLKPGENNAIEGTLKGGELSLKLKGFPRDKGGFLGTAKTDAGEFASYFQVVAEGGGVTFDLIQANADGDPDYTKATHIKFPAKAAGATPKPEPGEDEQADADDTDMTGEGSAAEDETENEAGPATTASPNPVVAGQFSGKWQGDGLTFDSKAQGNDFVGTLTLNGAKMPFTATALNGVLHGEFEVGGDRFDFQGRLQNGTLILSSSDTTYNLRPLGGANPLAKPNPLAKKPATARPNPLASKPSAPSSPKKPASTPQVTTPKVSSPLRPVGAPKGGAAWKTFKHPVGLALRYPANWALKDVNGALMLTPPDVKQIDGGPAEIFLVAADNAGGIKAGNDPRLEQEVDKYITQNFAGFTRRGETRQISAGNQPGIMMEWEGAAGAYPARIQVMSTILKSFAVSMVAISTKDQIKTSRDQTIKQIFESLVAGAGAKDPHVVGKWFLYAYKGSGSYGRETKSYMTLLPDGTAIWGQQSESSWSGQGKDSLGDTTWTAGVAGQNNSGDRGTWTAGQGRLLVAWGDGTTGIWGYRVGGSPGGNRRLFLTKDNGKIDEWMEIR